MKKTAFFLVVTLTASGCASYPVPMGDGWYQLDHTSAWGAGGSEDGVKADAHRKAAEFCAKENKKSQVAVSYAQGGVLYMQLAKASIQFRCVDELGK